MTTGRAPGVWTGAFLAMFGVNLACFGSVNLLVSTLPPHLMDLGHGEAGVGAIFGSFFLSCVISRALASRMTARLGPVVVLRLSMLVAIFGNALFLLVGDFWGRVAARLVFGVSFGLTTTILVSMAAMTLPTARLAEGLGYLSLAPPISLAACPLISLYLVDRWNFSILQAVVILDCLAGLAVSLKLKPAEFPAPPAKSPKEAKPPGGSGPLPAAFLAFLLGSANTSVFAYLALYFRELSISGTAYFFALATIGMISTRIFGGRIYDRHGHFWVVVPSVGLIEASILALILFPGPQAAAWAGLVFGLGMGTIFPAFQVLAISSVPDSRKTAAAAMALNGTDLGMFLNTLAMGLIAGVTGTYETVFKVSAVLIVLIWLTYALHPAFRRRAASRAARK